MSAADAPIALDARTDIAKASFFIESPKHTWNGPDQSLNGFIVPRCIVQATVETFRTYMWNPVPRLQPDRQGRAAAPLPVDQVPRRQIRKATDDGGLPPVVERPQDQHQP